MDAGHICKDTPAQAWARALRNIAPLARDGLAAGAPATLAGRLDAVAARHGGRPAFIEETRTVSHQALARRKNQYARWALGAGIGPGCVVGIMMLNGAEMMALWLGLTQVGAVAALIATPLAGEALVHVVEVSGALHLVADAACAPALQRVRGRLAGGLAFWTAGQGGPGADWLQVDCSVSGAPLAPGESGDTACSQTGGSQTGDGETALLLFTSGTTGLPKAARLSHHRVLEWCLWFAGMLDVSPQDRLYNCLPMYHATGGVLGCGAVLLGGGAVVSRRRFSAAGFWPDIVAHQCTIFLYIGELCRILLRMQAGPAPAHALRLCCGNGLQADIWTAFQERLAMPRILEFYASTEGNLALYNLEERPGAVGRLPPFLARHSPVMLAACDEDTGALRRGADGFCTPVAAGEAGEALGRISVTHATRRFEGYTDPAASSRKVVRDVAASGDAWFRTGDLMRKDADGFYYFVDRLGDTFRWKGENVSTSEVARAIQRCPGVLAATVFAVRVPGCDGRAGMAAICPGAGFDIGALAHGLAGNLPAYAQPVFVRLCAALESTPTHKPVKTLLAKDGFAIDAFDDPVYLRCGADGSYARLDAGRLRMLLDGELRL